MGIPDNIKTYHSYHSWLNESKLITFLLTSSPSVQETILLMMRGMVTFIFSEKGPIRIVTGVTLECIDVFSPDIGSFCDSRKAWNDQRNKMLWYDN